MTQHLQGSILTLTTLKITRSSDPTDTHIHNPDRSGLYGDITKELSPNISPPTGNVVNGCIFTDATHAGNVIMQHSHSAIPIHFQDSPIVKLS